MSINRGMDKEDVYTYIHGILVMKKNKIMPFTTIWMELKIVILSEVNHLEKDEYHMTSLIRRIFKKRGGRYK